jgi:hypothetical protein
MSTGDKKFSQLPAATLPLSGTESVVLVQGAGGKITPAKNLLGMNLPAATLPLSGTELVPIMQGGAPVNAPSSALGGGGGAALVLTTTSTLVTAAAATVDFEPSIAAQVLTLPQLTLANVGFQMSFANPGTQSTPQTGAVTQSATAGTGQNLLLNGVAQTGFSLPVGASVLLVAMKNGTGGTYWNVLLNSGATFTPVVVLLPLGINLDGLSYAEPSPFLNIFKNAGQFNGLTLIAGQGSYGNASPWITQDASSNDTWEEGYVQLDANGYPTSLTASPVPAIGQQFTNLATILIQASALAINASVPYPTGPYTLSGQGAGTFAITGPDVSGWTGNGSTVTVNGSNQFVSTSTSGTWSVTFTLTANGVGNVTRLQIIATDPLASGNYLRSLSLCESARVAALNGGAIFHPNFLQMLPNPCFSSVRVMKWLLTEQQEQAVTFSAAPSGTSATIKDCASITASVTGGVLTVTATLSGSIPVNAGPTYTGAGITAGARILRRLSGSGGTGTWAVTNVADTTGSITMTVQGSWQGPAQLNDVFFSSGEMRVCTFTPGSNVISWSGALAGSPLLLTAYYTPYATYWSRRSIPTAFSYAGNLGVPAEICFALCNAVAADCEYPLPLMAVWSNPTTFSASKYLTPLNTLALATLNAGLRLSREPSNEVWNFQYASNFLAHFGGYANWPANGPPGPYPITFTGAPALSATSATLTAPWPFANYTNTITFSTGENHSGTFLNGSTAVTWSGGLGSGANTANATVALNFQLNRNFYGMTAALTKQQSTIDWAGSASRSVQLLGAQYADYTTMTAAMDSAYWFASAGLRASSFSIDAVAVAPYFGGFTSGFSQIMPVTQDVQTMMQQLDGGLTMFFNMQTSNVAGTVTFTGALVAATSATLTAALPNGTYPIVFSDSSSRTVTVSGGTAATWTGAVTASAAASIVFADLPTTGYFGQWQPYLATFTSRVGPGNTYPGLSVMAYEGGPNHAFGGSPNNATLANFFTAGPASGSTSATLTNPWPYTSGSVNVTFSDAEVKSVAFVFGQTTATWVGGLANTVTSTAILSYTVLLDTAMRDARMGAFMKAMLQWWAAGAGTGKNNVFHDFTLAGRYSSIAYGAAESQFQVFSPLSDARVPAKWLALVKYALSLP